MGCVSSKILSKSGSFQEKVVSHGFKGSNLIEEIILSTPKKSNGDQFLALLRTSTSSASAAASRAKDAADQSTTAAAVAAEEFVKIETINVSELLAGLEEEEEEEERDDGERCSAQACVLDGAVATPARATSFRTVEEFDALVTRSGSSEVAEAASSADQDATGAKPSEQEEAATAAAGNKRRARARQLGELKVPLPPAFDFSKSGSLRDWLLQGGQIFSPYHQPC